MGFFFHNHNSFAEHHMFCATGKSKQLVLMVPKISHAPEGPCAAVYKEYFTMQ